MTSRASVLEGARIWALGAMAIVAYATIHLVMTSGSQFCHDDWWYLCGRSLADIDSWLRPHNEHFVLLHVVAYRSIVELFGIGSHVPFTLALIGVHVAVVAAIFVLVDRHASRGPAAAAALLMLFLGSGALNLLWTFQIGMVGATALGLWAIVLLPNRPVAAALVLTAAVATVGIGLIYVVAAGAYLLALGRIRSIAWLAVPLFVYGLWALLMRAPVDERVSLDVLAILTFMASGIAYTVAGTMGLGLPSAALGAVGVIVSRPTAWRSPIVVASAIALVAQFTLLGLVRQELTWPGNSHYVYTGSTFVILIGATLLASAARPAVGKILFAIALAANIFAFLFYGIAWPAHTERHNDAGEGHPPPEACYVSPGFEEIKRQAGLEGG